MRGRVLVVPDGKGFLGVEPPIGIEDGLDERGETRVFGIHGGGGTGIGHQQRGGRGNETHGRPWNLEEGVPHASRK
jgi:hypothetical protein